MDFTYNEMAQSLQSRRKRYLMGRRARPTSRTDPYPPVFTGFHWYFHSAGVLSTLAVAVVITNASTTAIFSQPLTQLSKPTDTDVVPQCVSSSTTAVDDLHFHSETLRDAPNRRSAYTKQVKPHLSMYACALSPHTALGKNLVTINYSP